MQSMHNQMISFHLIGTMNSQRSRQEECFIQSLTEWWHAWTADPLLPGRSPAWLHALGRFSWALRPQKKPNIKSETVDSLMYYEGQKFKRTNCWHSTKIISKACCSNYSALCEQRSLKDIQTHPLFHALAENINLTRNIFFFFKPFH